MICLLISYQKIYFVKTLKSYLDHCGGVLFETKLGFIEIKPIRKLQNFILNTNTFSKIMNIKAYLRIWALNIDMNLLKLHNTYIWIKHFTKNDVNKILHLPLFW